MSEVAGRKGEGIGEERAARILERAAALDAKRSSELSIEQLREAAVAAGISPNAFDEAIQEVELARIEEDVPGFGQLARTISPDALAAPGVARLARLLSDIQDGNGQLSMVGDRLEWKDGRGLLVSVTPGRHGSTVVVSGERSFRKRVFWPFVLGGLFTAFLFLIALLSEGEEVFVAAFFTSLAALVLSLIGSRMSFRREREASAKRTEWIRERLVRALGRSDREGGDR